MNELPPALRPWSGSLAFLKVEAALHLGPLVRRLDGLVRRHDAAHATLGEPDGYGGLTNRGHPERLLLSEWLLAEELPLEFIRRAAGRELLHVAPTFRTVQPAGSVAVFCDAGPDQLGAARLVQLAALIVLHRRAASRGSQLLVGLSGEPAETWHRGDLPEQFDRWRSGRSAAAPDADELVRREAALDDAGELWVLAGARLAASAGDRPLLLETREAAWDETGATAVDVRFERRSTTLAVPPGQLSVQTLRGQALRREPVLSSTAKTGTFSCPSFSSADRRLLLRGERPELLVTTTVPTNRRGGAARPRTHRFSGPVVAASSLGGKRLVALVLGDDGRLRCEVVGKELWRLEDIEAPLDLLDVDRDALFDALPPVFLDDGALLVRLGEAWWRILGEGAEQVEGLVAVGPTRQIDQPHKLWRHQLPGPAGQAIAGGRVVAWCSGTRWYFRGQGARAATIDVEGGDVALGVLGGDEPAVVTVSASGLIVRVHTERAVRTLTACSGPASARALNAAHGLLAVQRDAGHLDVHDVLNGELIVTVRAQ